MTQKLSRLAAACTALLLLTQISTAARTAPASLPVAGNNTGCTLTVPARWGAKTMTWSGACKNKRAHGNGVARMLANGKPVSTWYGDVSNGAPAFGVHETAEGLEMGKFVNGGFLSSDAYYTGKENPADGDPARQAFIHALGRGAMAAEALAAKFAQQGNKASAAYYRKKAEQINDTLD